MDNQRGRRPAFENAARLHPALEEEAWHRLRQPRELSVRRGV